MERVVATPAVASDAAAVTEVVGALESWLYGQTTFSPADLKDEWSDLDVERDARVVRDGDRVYERAGMGPALGWAMYEKELGDPA